MSRKPNILFINVDQQRYDSLGFTGNTIVKTPNLDRIAARGMSFVNAFTPIAVCSPARQSLLCSLTPELHGCFWVYGIGHATPDFSPEHDIWVRHLKELEYITAYVGKWHVNPKIDPTGFGFDYYIPERDYCRPLIDSENFDYGNTRKMLEMFETGDIETSHTHVLAKEVINLIEQFSGGDKPWHIRLDYSEPHSPCNPAGRFANMYNPDDIPPWGSFAETFENKPYIQLQQLYTWDVQDWTWEEWSQYVAKYYGIISQIDDAIGIILRHLEDLDIMKDTIIIYTTDHGDMAGGHRTMEKVHNMYEDIYHVPLVARWDGVIKPGTVNHDFISHYLDLGPTILDILSLSIPETYQGISFYPQLKGEVNSNTRSCITASYHGQQFGLYSQRMIRDYRYKLVWNFTDICEFYDLQQDSYELNNLIAEPSLQNIIYKYQIRLYEELKKLKDPIVDTIWIRNQLMIKGRKIISH